MTKSMMNCLIVLSITVSNISNCNSKYQEEHIDFSIIIELMKNDFVQNVLALKKCESKNCVVRIIDKINYIDRKYSGINIDSDKYISIANDFTYNFNTGIAREIVVNKFEKERNGNYQLSVMLYQFESKESKTNIYSLILNIKKDAKHEFHIIGYKYGDID